MRRIPPAGLKSRHLIPKTVRSCLGSIQLPYNWNTKVPETIVSIALARSVLLKNIARIGSKQVTTGIEVLSRFLNHKKLNTTRLSKECAKEVLRRLGSRRFRLYRGKVILIIDGTEYEKPRSRGKKKAMPKIGKVRLKNLPEKKKLLVPGYKELWTGLLLKNRTCLGISRKLFTEKARFFTSQNMLEEAEILDAEDLVKEALKRKVILVADSGFGRKELLQLLSRRPKTDFLIRLQGNLSVEIDGQKGLLSDLALCQRERVQTFWRDSSKRALLCSVRAFRVRMPMSKKSSFEVNMLCVTPTKGNRRPILLATTLPIETVESLISLVHFYSARWTIETFFFNFKESFKVSRFRVFSSWKAVDRLLAMAHMAFLVLHMIYVLAQSSKKRSFRLLSKSIDTLLKCRSLKPLVLTLGKFFEAINMDFLEFRSAWEGL